MKKLFAITAAFAVTAASCLRADTSYLLFQGPFGPGSAEATFKWQVNYQPGVLVSGQNLLTAVFGAPTSNGTYTDGFATTYNYYSSGNSTKGAGYIDFGLTSQLTSPFLVSVTLGSTTVVQAPDYSTGWNYYVAGGGGAHAYPNAGVWSYSDDGSTTRTLANGSYDAWVFGNTFPAAAINGSLPTGPNFSGATAINVVPEPASAALLLLGAGGLLAMSKRRRAS